MNAIMAGKLYKGRKQIGNQKMKKINSQSNKSSSKKFVDGDLYHCPACSLIAWHNDKYQTCKKCKHLFTGKKCECCDSMDRRNNL